MWKTPHYVVGTIIGIQLTCCTEHEFAYFIQNRFLPRNLFLWKLFTIEL